MTTRTRVAKVTNFDHLSEIVDQTQQYTRFLTAKNPSNPVYCVVLRRGKKGQAPTYADVYIQMNN